MTQILQTPPSPLPIYLKAAMTAGRKPPPGVSLPPLQVALMNVRTDPARLDAYRQVCGLAEAPGLPLTYPQIAATGLHMHLMTQPQFPFPLLGLVHVRNRIRQTRPLGVDEAYDLHVSLGEVREARAGLEFDLLTEARVGDEAVWEASTTVLYRNRKPAAAGGKPPPPPADTTLSEYRSFAAPADIGRRYARVSGDYNPIHLYPVTARLFGFSRAIAHGMWSLARCLGELEAELARTPRELEVQFKQPLLLPARLALKFRAQGDQISFALLSSSADKVHLSGSLG